MKAPQPHVMHPEISKATVFQKSLAWCGGFWGTLSLVSVFGLGLILRLHYFGGHRLHIDECLYSGWAARILEHGDILLNGASGVDKPPLLMFVQACVFLFLGVSETTARIPSFFASLGSLILVHRIAHSLYGRLAAFLAVFFLAVSPLHVAYSSAAFTDPLMVFCALGAWVAFQEKRFVLAGVALGLALASKQFGVLYLGFFGLLLLGLPGGCRVPETRAAGKALLRGWALTVGVVLALTFFSNPTLGWILSVFNGKSSVPKNPPLAWSARFDLWRAPLGMVFNQIWLWWVAVGAAWWATMRAGRETNQPRRTFDAFSTGAWIFLAGYLTLLILSNVFPFARYILLILPMAVILVAGVLASLAQRAWNWGNMHGRALSVGGVISLVVLGLLALPQTERRAQGEGVFYSANDGIDEVAGYIRTQATPDTVLFTQGVGWCYNFYLRDCPLAARRDVKTPADLPVGIAAFPGKKYFYVYYSATGTPLTAAPLAGLELCFTPAKSAAPIRFWIYRVRPSYPAKAQAS